MRSLVPAVGWVSGVAIMSAVGVGACGNETGLVRDRVDAAAPTGAEAGPGLACGVAVPATYESPSYETNAAEELSLRKAMADFLAPMKALEAALKVDGGAPQAVTKAQLVGLFEAGAPSLKSVTTPYYQAKVDAWLAAYEVAAADGAYTPAEPNGVDKGGAFGEFIFDANGVDIRQAIEKGLYAAAFYNRAVGLIEAGSITTGTIDRMVALFGAHPSFPNNPSAAQYKDILAAAYAARRDAKDAANPGFYQKAKRSLLQAKAAVEAGAACTPDRDLALKQFLEEWEKSNFATVLYYLQDIIAKLSAQDLDLPDAMHDFGEIIGFISGYKSIASTHRIITDAQIDGVLSRIMAADGGPASAYKLKTNSVEIATRMQQAVSDIASVYGFTDAEVQSFKKNY